MSEKLTPWWAAQGLGKYAKTDELIALRAENEQLREALQTANGVVVSGTRKLNEARARVAKLEAALGWFLNDERFQVGVGGNPNAVNKMIADARAALSCEPTRSKE